MLKSVCWAILLQKNTTRRGGKIIIGQFFRKNLNFEVTLKPTNLQFELIDVFKVWNKPQNRILLPWKPIYRHKYYDDAPTRSAVIGIFEFWRYSKKFRYLGVNLLKKFYMKWVNIFKTHIIHTENSASL